MLTKHPSLMERPLIVTAERAFIGRPTERVSEFFGSTAEFDGQPTIWGRFVPGPDTQLPRTGLSPGQVAPADAGRARQDVPAASSSSTSGPLNWALYSRW